MAKIHRRRAGARRHDPSIDPDKQRPFTLEVPGLPFRKATHEKDKHPTIRVFTVPTNTNKRYLAGMRVLRTARETLISQADYQIVGPMTINEIKQAVAGVRELDARNGFDPATLVISAGGEARHQLAAYTTTTGALALATIMQHVDISPHQAHESYRPQVVPVGSIDAEGVQWRFLQENPATANNNSSLMVVRAQFSPDGQQASMAARQTSDRSWLDASAEELSAIFNASGSMHLPGTLEAKLHTQEPLLPIPEAIDVLAASLASISFARVHVTPPQA